MDETSIVIITLTFFCSFFLLIILLLTLVIFSLCYYRSLKDSEIRDLQTKYTSLSDLGPLNSLYSENQELKRKNKKVQFEYSKMKHKKDNLLKRLHLSRRISLKSNKQLLNVSSINRFNSNMTRFIDKTRYLTMKINKMEKCIRFLRNQRDKRVQREIKIRKSLSYNSIFEKLCKISLPEVKKFLSDLKYDNFLNRQLEVTLDEINLVLNIKVNRIRVGSMIKRELNVDSDNTLKKKFDIKLDDDDIEIECMGQNNTKKMKEEEEEKELDIIFGGDELPRQIRERSVSHPYDSSFTSFKNLSNLQHRERISSLTGPEIPPILKVTKKGDKRDKRDKRDKGEIKEFTDEEINALIEEEPSSPVRVYSEPLNPLSDEQSNFYLNALLKGNDNTK